VPVQEFQSRPVVRTLWLTKALAVIPQEERLETATAMEALRELDGIVWR